MSLIYTTDTFYIPQLIGGLILGFGFIIGGYCPGTSVVALASGKLDAILFIVGVIAGSLIFNEAWPIVKDIYTVTPKGRLLLPELMHMSYGTVVFIVVLLGLGAFVAAEWGEKVMARKGGAA